jgi:hypothetical protein
LIETFHWKVGAGFPLAATVKLVLPPAATDSETGWEPIEGAVCAGSTVRATGVDVTEPKPLAAKHSYS